MAVSVACLAALSFACLQAISVLGRSLDDAVNVTAQKVDLAGKSWDAFRELRSGMALNQIAYAVAAMGRGPRTVEAARAGEMGQGFAVVADEVRSLAQRCAKAANDTTGLIEESVRNCSHGKAQVGRLAEIVGAMADRSTRLRQLVEEVGRSSRQQTAGIAAVSGAVEQMSQITQRNAAGAQANAVAGEELSALSESLKSSVHHLRVMVDGDRAAAT
jgi:hypothetical protein